MMFTTRLSLNTGWVDVCKKGKRGVIDIIKSLKKLKSADSSIFQRLLDVQIEPILTNSAKTNI